MLKDRIFNAIEIDKAMEERKKGLFHGTSIDKHIVIEKRIGSKSRFGEAYRAHVIGKPDIPIAIKVIPHSKNAKNIEWMTSEAMNEISILRRLSDLVKIGITQNLPILYDVINCENGRYANKSLFRKGAPSTCFVALNELGVGNLLDWRMTEHSIEEWKSCIFQILAGMTVIEQYMGIIHGDLHDNNILYNEVTPGGCWHYRYVASKKEYNFYVPNTGQIWRLWDFGHAKRAKKTRKTMCKMWEDLELLFLSYLFGEILDSDKKKGIMPLPIQEDDVVVAVEWAMRKSQHVPAFLVIKKLNWFQCPRGKILNATPFSVCV